MSNKPTELQQLFIDALSDPNSPTFGDAQKSKVAAGYSDNTKLKDIMGGIPDDVIDAVNIYILSEAIGAAKAIVEVRKDPNQLGAANKLKAADSLLDRSGVVKKQQVEIKQESPTAIFFLPAKDYNLPVDESLEDDDE